MTDHISMLPRAGVALRRLLLCALGGEGEREKETAPESRWGNWDGWRVRQHECPTISEKATEVMRYVR